MLYTVILAGSHTIGNLVVSEAMMDATHHVDPDQGLANAPHRFVAYRVPHSLNDTVHLSTEATSAAEARALFRRACERVLDQLNLIMTTPPPVAPKPTPIEIRRGPLHRDSDIR